MIKVAIYAFLCLLLQGCGCDHNIRIFQQKLRPLDYFGVMKAKFIDSLDRGTPKVIFGNGTEIPMYAYEMYDELQLGDTVIKKAGSLNHILKRNGETNVFYPKCDGYEIK